MEIKTSYQLDLLLITRDLHVYYTWLLREYDIIKRAFFQAWRFIRGSCHFFISQLYTLIHFEIISNGRSRSRYSIRNV